MLRCSVRVCYHCIKIDHLELEVVCAPVQVVATNERVSHVNSKVRSGG